MITVSQLESFQDAPWNQVAATQDDQAKKLHDEAIDLRMQADALHHHWTSPAAAEAARTLVESAEKLDGLAEMMQTAAQTIRSTASGMNDRKADLATLRGWLSKKPVQLLDDGSVILTADAANDPGLRAFDQMCAEIGTLRAREILFRADATLHSNELALQALEGYQLPTSQTGPIDLDDESIRAAADINQQDRYGSCVWLANLKAIAQSDPDFIRRHMQWDPATGEYVVTLYDSSGQPVEVRVNPKTISADGAQAYGTQNPTWMGVYEEALRQLHDRDVRGGVTDEGFPPSVITGVPTPEGSPRNTSFDDIRQTLATQPPGIVCVATTGAFPGQGSDVPADQRMVGNHAYTVKGFDSEGRIVLVNPWGPAGGVGGDNKWYPGEVHLTEAQYHQWIGVATRTEQPFA